MIRSGPRGHPHVETVAQPLAYCQTLSRGLLQLPHAFLQLFGPHKEVEIKQEAQADLDSSQLMQGDAADFCNALLRPLVVFQRLAGHAYRRETQSVHGPGRRRHQCFHNTETMDPGSSGQVDGGRMRAVPV